MGNNGNVFSCFFPPNMAWKTSKSTTRESSALWSSVEAKVSPYISKKWCIQSGLLRVKWTNNPPWGKYPDSKIYLERIWISVFWPISFLIRFHDLDQYRASSELDVSFAGQIWAKCAPYLNDLGQLRTRWIFMGVDPPHICAKCAPYPAYSGLT